VILSVAGSPCVSTASCLCSCTNDVLYTGLDTVFMASATTRYSHDCFYFAAVMYHTTHTTTALWPFFRDHPGEPVPEENFWTSWCKGRLTEADTPTIRLGVTPSGLTSAHLHHPPYFLQAGCPSCRPTNSFKAVL